MNGREFWDRVDALLDERRDPLDDEAVQRHLAREPRAMDEYAQLTAALASLPRRRPTRRSIAILAIAGALLMALTAYMLLPVQPLPESTLPRHTSASSVLSFKMSVVKQAGPLRCTTTIEGDRRTDERELVVAASSESPWTHATLTTVRHRGILP